MKTFTITIYGAEKYIYGITLMDAFKNAGYKRGERSAITAWR